MTYNNVLVIKYLCTTAHFCRTYVHKYNVCRVLQMKRPKSIRLQEIVTLCRMFRASHLTLQTPTPHNGQTHSNSV